MNDKMDSTVPNEVRTILASSIKPSAFKSSRFSDKYAKKANNNKTQDGGIYGKRGRKWKNRNKHKKSEIISAENNTSTGNNSADNAAEEKSTENAPITITIPVTQQVATPVNTPQNAPIPFRSGNRGRGRGRYFGNGGRHGNRSGYGSGRSYFKYSGKFDAYCMDIAPQQQ